MTGLELETEREQLGVTHRELAEYADVTPADVRRWEQCEDVPPEFEHELRMALWSLRTEAALAEAALPECDYLRARAGAEPTPAPDEVPALQGHLASCDICRTRERFVLEQVGPPPVRATGGRLGGRVRRFLNTLQHWHRTHVVGSVLNAFLGRPAAVEPVGS